MAPSADSQALVNELAEIVGRERVSQRTADLDAYMQDMWARGLLARDTKHAIGKRPHVVVWPRTAIEIANVVRVAIARRMPIVPYGGGSGVCGGTVPSHGGIMLDTKRMNRVIQVDADNLTCEVEVGINGERLERLLNQRGLTLGHFPASMYCSTLGGWLAARSAGQLSTKYGKIEDMVLGVTAVTGRGDIIETGRHGRADAGPDWTQLLVGSEGTLGIMTAARLRLRPLPEEKIYRAFEFVDVAMGLEAIRRIMQLDLRPAVLRLYDPVDTMMAMHSDSMQVPARAQGKDSGPRERRRNRNKWIGQLRSLTQVPMTARATLRNKIVNVALHKPTILNAATSMFASYLVRQGCLLIVGLEGAKVRTTVESSLVFWELGKGGGRDLGEQPGREWLKHRYDTSYGMSKIYTSDMFVDTMEVAATWERVLDLYHEVRTTIGRRALVMAHMSHAYPEGCAIYFTFAGQASAREQAIATYDLIWNEAAQAALRAGGTISHHHGIGLLKAPHMQDEHRQAMTILRALKKTFDPDGIMNPGKLGLESDRSHAS